MPFKWKWPFKWPWSRAAAEPPAPEPERAQPPAAAPVQRHADMAAPISVDLSGPDDDLGAQLLGRLGRQGQPPTLGARAGLNDMARALPEVDLFLQRLPASPAPPPTDFLAPTQAIQSFASSLPGLRGFAAAGDGGLSFPEQLDVAPAQTGVLPPLGGLPDQVPGLSGAAPILQTPAQGAASAAATAGLPAPAAQRQVVTPAWTAAPVIPATGEAAPLVPAARPAVEALGLPSTPPLTLVDTTPLSQVLSPEAVLTGNVLPLPAAPPASLQREEAPLAAAPSVLGELVQPPAPSTVERVTVIEREIIESQRGQGQPLPPETREHFERVYGEPLDSVRIHTGPTVQRVAESLNAAAFASGTDVFFAPGVFQPSQPAGMHIVGHELAHVIQQKYGPPPADAGAVQPPSHPAERQAEALAARAVATPLAAPAAPEAGPAPLQRAADFDVRLGQWPAPTLAQPDDSQPETLRRAQALDTASQALGTAPLAGADAAAPVQRFSVDELAGLRQSAPSALPVVAAGRPTAGPELEAPPARVSGLTDQLPNPGGMLANLNSAARDLPVQRVLSTQIILGGPQSPVPVLSRAFDLDTLTDNLPAPPQLPDSALAGLADPVGLPGPGAMTDLAGSLPTPSGALPSLSGLRLPEMPLPALGDLGQMAAGAAATGQEALGSVVGLAQSAADSAAAPALPNIDKLTDQIWKSIQQKLRVERERSRGLA